MAKTPISKVGDPNGSEGSNPSLAANFLILPALEEGVMRIYLDDERKTPKGWVRAFWPQEVIQLLKTKNVTEISLDHDLGNDERGTGYHVILWIEEAVFNNGFIPPDIKVHSANSSARIKMEAGINNIKRLSVR